MSTPSGASERESLDPELVAWARGTRTADRLHVVSSPPLAKLLAIGTEHVYADTADVDELRTVLVPHQGSVIGEVDGNTVNQPLVRHVIDRYVADEGLGRHAGASRSRGVSDGALLRQLYTAVCARIGNDVIGAFASGRPWEPSLQLHMGATRDAATAVALGHALRSAVPGCLVKVPFLPHAPACFLIARDLERQGAPVNFTSTFSARQAVAAALLTDATRTNVFMGRLSQGLDSELLGEHVTLEAQRALRHLRRDLGVKTRLIVASMRRWESFVLLAGCDVFTAPCPVLRAFLDHGDQARGEMTSQLETSYEDRVHIGVTAVNSERVARLWEVEPEFVEFLSSYRTSSEYRALTDGERLARRFDDAGFGDFFDAPDASDWSVLRRSKLPDFTLPLSRRVALDTLYSLLADGDFDNTQDAIDAILVRGVAQAA